MMMVFDDIKTIPYKLSFHNFFQYLIPSLLIHIELDPTFYYTPLLRTHIHA